MIVVTGATGHIGNVLVRELLAEGYTVRAMVMPEENTDALSGLSLSIVTADITKPDTLDNAFSGADTVFHLAGMIDIGAEDYELLHRVNVQGTQNVIQASLKHHVKRLIYTSSVHALAEKPHGFCIDETQPFDPQQVTGNYAKTKALASLEVLHAAREGLDAIIVCPSGIIGPYDYRLSEIGKLIQSFNQNKMLAYVEGSYDFVDVRDVANGLIRAMVDGEKGETYILSGERITVKELLNALANVSGKKSRKLKVPYWFAYFCAVIASVFYKIRKKHGFLTPYSIYTLRSNAWFSNNKAREKLRFAPRPIFQSIADSVRWLLENKKHSAV